jgi:hypothetical protein
MDTQAFLKGYIAKHAAEPVESVGGAVTSAINAPMRTFNKVYNTGAGLLQGANKVVTAAREQYKPEVQQLAAQEAEVEADLDRKKQLAKPNTEHNRRMAEYQMSPDGKQRILEQRKGYGEGRAVRNKGRELGVELPFSYTTSTLVDKLRKSSESGLGSYADQMRGGDTQRLMERNPDLFKYQPPASEIVQAVKAK